MDDIDATVIMDPSGQSKGEGRTETSGSNMAPADSTESTKGEDVAGQTAYPVSLAFADRVDSMMAEAECADPIYYRSGKLENTIDNMDQNTKSGSNDGGSDSDSTSEGTCLEAMTPDGQDYYLRLGNTPRRRSALRLSRIIARQQLLRRLAQGSQ